MNFNEIIQLVTKPERRIMSYSKLGKGILILTTLFIFACEAEQVEAEFDCSSTNLIIEAQKTDVSCNAADGLIEANTSGGLLPYTYSIGDTSNETGEFSQLAAGNYSLTVTDANGCSATESIVIANLDGVNIASVDVTGVSCSDEASGELVITAQGGEEPYSFQLNEETPTTSNSFSNLVVGSYDIKVVDNNGCTSEQTVDIDVAISLENDIMPIFSTNCSGCHSSQSPKLVSKDDIINSASSALSAIKAGRMPKGGPKLSDAKIAQIECWINAGKPNN